MLEMHTAQHQKVDFERVSAHVTVQDYHQKIPLCSVSTILW